MNQEQSNKTSKLDILQYGFGGAGSNMLLSFIVAFLMFFLTDKAGVSATIAGAIYLSVRILDIFTYPTMGIILDRTNSKWGKYRPYILWGTPFLILTFVLLFTVPNLSGTLKIPYFWIMYTLFCVMYVVVVVSYQSLTPIMSSDSQQRNFVVMSRELLGIISIVLVNALTLPLAKKFGGDAGAWQKVAIIYSVLAIIFMYLCANGAKKYDIADEVKKSEKVSLKEQLKTLTTNKALLFLVLTFAFSVLANSTISAANVYFYSYVVKDISLVSKNAIVSLPFIIAAVASVPFLAKKFGKNNILKVAISASFIQPIVLLLFKPFTNIYLLLALFAFNSVALFIVQVTSWSMVPDCVEYSRWKTGKQSVGLITSIFSFSNKIGSAIGGALVGLILGAVGYTASKVQPQDIINVIVYIYTIIPILTGIVGLLSIKHYPITTEFFKKMMKEINEKTGIDD